MTAAYTSPFNPKLLTTELPTAALAEGDTLWTSEGVPIFTQEQVTAPPVQPTTHGGGFTPHSPSELYTILREVDLNASTPSRQELIPVANPNGGRRLLNTRGQQVL